MGLIAGVYSGGAIQRGPTTNGSDGQALTGDGAGNLSFATVIGGSTGSTDNRLVRSDGTGGKTVQATGITVDDSNNVTGVETLRAVTSIGIASKPYFDSSADSKWAIRNALAALLVDFAETMAGSFTVQADVNTTGTAFRINGNQVITNSFPTLGINSSGTYTNTAITKQLAYVPNTPSQITSNQNNYAPTAASVQRLSTDASRDITGLSVGQIAGTRVEFWNVGAQNIVLKHEDSNSTAANRFTNSTGADITLAAGEEASLKYDGTTSRWRVRKIA